MDQESFTLWMIGLLLFDLILLGALLRGARLGSDLKALLLFLLRSIR